MTIGIILEHLSSRMPSRLSLGQFFVRINWTHFIRVPLFKHPHCRNVVRRQPEWRHCAGGGYAVAHLIWDTSFDSCWGLWDLIFPTALWLWGRLSLWHKCVPRISFGVDKGCRCVGLTTLSPSCAGCLDILGVSNSWTHQGLFRSVQCYVTFHLLTLILLTWRIWWVSNNVSKWQIGFTFHLLTPILLTWRMWWASNNVSKWQIGFTFHLLTLILLTWRIWWASNNVSKWQIGFTFHLLTLILLTWRIWWASNNVNKWQIGFIFHLLTLILLTWRIWWASNNVCKWQIGVTFHLLTLILLMWRIWWASNNVSKWQIGFN